MNATDTSTTQEQTLPTAAKLRQFAQDAGLAVGSRGTIPSSVKTAFLSSGKRTQKKYV